MKRAQIISLAVLVLALLVMGGNALSPPAGLGRACGRRGATLLPACGGLRRRQRPYGPIKQKEDHP